MKMLSKENFLFLIVIITFNSSVKSADWNVSAPVVVSHGHSNDKIIINNSIEATENNEAVIKVNASLGGMIIDTNINLKTSDGFWNGTAFTPDTSTINITESGDVTGTIENRGYIQNGINVEGSISVMSDSALKVEGITSTNKAVILESISLRNGGTIKSENEHAINISQHGFVDFISIDSESYINAKGMNKSAIYVDQQGMLGGDLNQEVASSDILFYDNNDATPIVNIHGEIKSINGSGIKIDGTAVGSIILSGGNLKGKKDSENAAIRINGKYMGTVQNYGGTITGGIVVAGEHYGAEVINPSLGDIPANLAAGDRSSYISTGGSGKYAELKGGYVVLAGGKSEATENHGIYLNEYSKADQVIAQGTLSSTEDSKSAIFVANNAILGENADSTAISVASGGVIKSSKGSAIEVDGLVNGWVVNNGTIITDRADDTNDFAIDFSDAGSALKFSQSGEMALTKGRIAGSALSTDKIELSGGRIESKSITDVERIQLTGGRIESNSTTGVESIHLTGGRIDSDIIELTGGVAGNRSIELDNGTIESNSITGVNKINLTGGSVNSDTIEFADGINGNASIEFNDGTLKSNSIIGVNRIKLSDGSVESDIIEFAGGMNIDRSIELNNNGTIKSNSITGVDRIKLTGGSIDSDIIEFAGGMNGNGLIELTSGMIKSNSITGVNKINLTGGSIESNSITGLDHITISTDANLNIKGNYSAPAETLVLVESGYNPDAAIITVDDTLSVNSLGSHIMIKPGSAEAFNELVDKKMITLIDYNNGLKEELTNSFSSSSSSNAEYISYSNLLFDVAHEFTDAGKLMVNIIPNSLEEIVNGVDGTDEQKILLLNAIKAAITKNSGDIEKQNLLLSRLTEGQAQELIDDFGYINPNDMQGLQAVQQTVMHRLQLITGIGFGDSYFDYDDYDYENYDYNNSSSNGSNFTFLSGSGWGQFIIGNGKHKNIQGGNDFKSKMTGFIVGADTNITNTIRIGGAGSWTKSILSGAGLSKSTTNNFMASLYGHWYVDGWYSDAIISIGRSSSDTAKKILGYDIMGSYKGNTLGARLITGRKFGMWLFDISPQSELNYGYMKFDAYEEKGNSGFEQKVKIADYNVMEFGLGFRLSLPVEDGYRIRPEFILMGYYDIKNASKNIESTYLAGGEPFVLTGPQRDKYRFQSGLSLAVDIMDSLSLVGAYNINISKHFLSHNFSAKAKYEF